VKLGRSGDTIVGVTWRPDWRNTKLGSARVGQSRVQLTSRDQIVPIRILKQRFSYLCECMEDVYW